MPNRELREGILTSEKINFLSFAAELFYRRLMSVIDDFGRYHSHPTLLKAACYPLKLNEVTDADILNWLEECRAANLLVLYESAGKKCLELVNFRNRKRALHSKFPPPLTDSYAEEKKEPELKLESLTVTPHKSKTQLADTEFIATLKLNPAYKGIDIDRELGKARAWLLTPAGRRRQLTRQFFVNWLNRIDLPMRPAPATPKKTKPEQSTEWERVDKLWRQMGGKDPQPWLAEIGQLSNGSLRLFMAGLTIDQKNVLQRCWNRTG